MMKAVVFLMASLLLLVAGCNKVRDAAATGSQNGTLTRFVTVGNYLYTVDNNHLNTYSIANPAQPVLKGTQPVGFSIQTIFPYQDKLFIGSANAMFIYSIANPEKPTLLSETEYFVRGRDPIVAFDSVAYSTVQNNRLGVGSSGVLNVFNIKNPSLPRRVFMIALQQPFGLGAKDSALYVCDGTAGLKLFNISKPYEPVSRGSFSQQEVFYDLIVEGNTLIAYIKGGVCLIDITNVLDPSLIAKLKN